MSVWQLKELKEFGYPWAGQWMHRCPHFHMVLLCCSLWSGGPDSLFEYCAKSPLAEAGWLRWTVLVALHKDLLRMPEKSCFLTRFDCRVKAGQLQHEENNQWDVGCAEQQMVARQWAAEVGCCCPHFVMSYLSARETRPAFHHEYIKCPYSFRAAVISLTRDVKKPTKLQPCFSSFQERICVFSDVCLFHFCEKGSAVFVVVCWRPKMMVKGKQKQAGDVIIPARWDFPWTKGLVQASALNRPSSLMKGTFIFGVEALLGMPWRSVRINTLKLELAIFFSDAW